MQGIQNRNKKVVYCCRLLLLGIFCLSLMVARSQNLNNPNKVGPLGIRVNTLSGNVFIPRTDIFIPSKGMDLDLSFHYNSFLYTEDYGYGNGWTFQYNIKYSHDSSSPGGRLIMWGDGREDQYDSLPGGAYRAPKGFFSTLSQYQPGKYVLTELNGMKYIFDDAAHKRITRMEDANGNFINFIYTDSLLSEMNSGAGQAITFSYDVSGRLESITDANGSPVRVYNYSYDLAGNLKQVTNPLGGIYQFAYLVNGPMKSMTDRNNNKADIIYYPDFTARELIGCNKRLSFSYDSSSGITVATEHLETGNQVTKYRYETVNGYSWLKSVTGNCCGNNMSYEYDSLGNRVKIVDANGQTYRFTYDLFGNMLTSTDPLGNVSTYTYTSDFKKISSFRDAKGNQYNMTYDAKGNLTQLVAPEGKVYTATYSATGEIITSKDPNGNTYTYVYDAYGNPVSVSGPNGYSASLSFDARGRLLSYVDANGNASAAEYDILNRLRKITDPLNNTVQFNYDAEGNPVVITNENNESATLGYDASNRLVKLTGPTGHSSSFLYDGADNLLSIKDALGQEARFVYDQLNRMTSAEDSERNKMLFDYDGNGNITRVVLPNGRIMSYSYDQMNRVVSVQDEAGTMAEFGYDKNANVISYRNATGATQTSTYDSLNRIKSITDPLGNTTHFSYDKMNNIIAVTDREGHTSQYTYDSLNRVKTYTDNNGFVLSMGYDAQGNIVSVTDQNGNNTTYTYDQLNRRKRMTYPDGRYNEMNYDNKGNLVSIRQTDATVITYQYDTLNRITSRTMPDGEVYAFTYDKLGRLLSATNRSGTTTFTYDMLSRVTSETFDGRAIQYAYSLTGRKQTTIYPDGTELIKEFDTRNRLVKVSRNGSVLATYLYNPADQLIEKKLGNGVNTIMQYDFANRLSSFTTTASSGIIQNSKFTYDKENNKTAILRTDNPSLSEAFGYDDGYRLISYRRGPTGSPVVQQTYTYDAVGNRTSANLNGVTKTYSVNNLNQVTGVNAVNFTYDGRGNLTFDGLFYKTYDSENRLIKDSSSPASVITYGYDALQRRVLKTINGNALKYTYSGVAQIEERSAGGAVISKHMFTGLYAPLYHERNGNSFYYHSNELGTVEAMTGNTGRLVEKYVYDVYGKPSRFDSLNNPLASSITGNRFGFTGQEYDSATASYRFFFRNYSPETGVFNQRDLIEYQDGMGMYQYVRNNPANGVDVWGLDAIDDEYALPPGYKYDVMQMYGGKDPCYHDPNKIKLITNSEVRRTKETIMENLKKFGDGLWADYEGIGSADSRFYTKLMKSQIPTGDNMYYFKGEVMHNYEVNYYFTGYASGLRGYGNTAASNMSKSWNVAKGFKELLWDWAGPGRLLNSLSDNEIRTRNMVEGNMDNEFGTAMMRNPEFNSQALDNKVIPNYGEWWPVINPKTGEMGYEFFAYYKIKSEHVMGFRQYVRDNCMEDKGTKKKRPKSPGDEKEMKVLTPFDPNEILGPDGQPDKKWVSVKDRLPYTILFENDSSASARARYVKITSPVEPKQDAATLELGTVGFNNQSFDIPPGTSSYYKRLDARDSTGVYVDLTAGYDFFNNQIFWEFQAIDPISLLPPDDPNAGFLFLQDSTQPAYGNGFVNFSLKPKVDAQTLDTIGARAFIIFDQNEVIPTNIHTNTIDAVAPISQINPLNPNITNPVNLTWTGSDDPNGCGIDFYTVYVSTDLVNYSVLFPKVYGNDTTFTLPTGSSYCFFVLATDRVGNAETLRTGASSCTFLGSPIPITWLYFNGVNQGKNNLLSWATTSEQNSREFRLERSLDGIRFNQIAVLPAAGYSLTERRYEYTDRNIDKLNSRVMFYRVKQVDADDQSRYSNIVNLQYQQEGVPPTIVYPNPTRGIVNLLIGDDSVIGKEAILSDIHGRILSRLIIRSVNQQIVLTPYANGIYFIRLSNKEVLRVMKQ